MGLSGYMNVERIEGRIWDDVKVSSRQNRVENTIESHGKCQKEQAWVFLDPGVTLSKVRKYVWHFQTEKALGRREKNS